MTNDQIVAALGAAGQDNQADMLAAMPGVVPGAGHRLRRCSPRSSAWSPLIYIASSLFSWGQSYIMAGVTQRTVYRLRERVDQKLGRLPLAYFDRESRGDILSRVTNDIDNISQTLQQSLTQLITRVPDRDRRADHDAHDQPAAGADLAARGPGLDGRRAARRPPQPARSSRPSGSGPATLNGHVEEMHTGHAIVKLFGHQEEAIDEFDAPQRRRSTRRATGRSSSPG